MSSMCSFSSGFRILLSRRKDVRLSALSITSSFRDDLIHLALSSFQLLLVVGEQTNRLITISFRILKQFSISFDSRLSRPSIRGPQATFFNTIKKYHERDDGPHNQIGSAASSERRYRHRRVHHRLP